MTVVKANRIYNRKFNEICEEFLVKQTITQDEFIQKWNRLKAKLNRQKYEAAGIRV